MSHVVVVGCRALDRLWRCPDTPETAVSFSPPVRPLPRSGVFHDPIHRSGTANDALSRCQEKCAHAAGRKALSS